MTDIKVGDEVRILKHRTRYDSSFPEDGYTGTVTKVARKYAKATYVRQRTAYPPGPVEETIEFDMETGKVREGTDYGSNYNLYVRTAEQHEREQRQSAASAVLFARKIRLDYSHGLTLEQIEALAEVVKSWDQEEGR